MLNPIKKTVLMGACCALLMFGFSFALSPLYRIVCKTTGLNGGVNVAEINDANANSLPDTQKNITVQFVATNNDNLPWDFYPQKNTLVVHPEQTAEMHFFAKNNTKHTMTVQAIPSFAPAVSARYFHKIECFCFRQQTLKAGESKDMAVVFRVDKALPADIHIITLAYTLFDVTQQRKSG